MIKLRRKLLLIATTALAAFVLAPSASAAITSCQGISAFTIASFSVQNISCGTDLAGGSGWSKPSVDGTLWSQKTLINHGTQEAITSLASDGPIDVGPVMQPTQACATVQVYEPTLVGDASVTHVMVSSYDGRQHYESWDVPHRGTFSRCARFPAGARNCFWQLLTILRSTSYYPSSMTSRLIDVHYGPEPPVIVESGPVLD